MHDALFSIARALNIQRPLFAFDLESTGLSVEEDRIVSIAWARVEPADPSVPGPELRTNLLITTGASLVNPMQRIPEEATAVHGITDAHVVASPTFGQLATEFARVVTGCDLLAFNGRRFDVRLLAHEFHRVGGHIFVAVAEAIRQARVIDPCAIFHKKEARDLTAAYKFYCDRELGDEAHGAEADLAACVEVMAAQLVCYDDLPRSVEGLHAFCEDRQPSWIDREGKIVWRDGEACLGFGPKAGVSLKRLVMSDPGLLDWILRKDFPEDTKAIIRAALRRQFPTPPASSQVA